MFPPATPQSRSSTRRIVSIFLVGTLLSVLVQTALAWISPSKLTSTSQTRSFPGNSFTMVKASSASTGSSSGTTMATTSTNPLPRLPIPDAICSDVPGTWAYDTMSRRVNEEILERTVQDCADDLATDALEPIRRRIETLRAELTQAASTPLTDLDPKAAPSDKEWQEWHAILEPYLAANDTWLTAPWMVTEFYVYRRLMQCFEYWTPDSPGYMYDPFRKQKQAGLITSVGSSEPALARIAGLPVDSEEGLQLAVSLALWGNKMDLSLWPANVESSSTDVFSSILHAATENLLHDDTHALAEYLNKMRKSGGGAIDIIVDNAGFELVTDLALAQYLVESGIAHTVTFQLKSHPTFVSDALERDLQDTVDYYAALDAKEYPAAHAAGNKWRAMLRDGKWRCVEDNFWCQAFAMWDMTEPLRSDMVERCDLAFVKGDANYRRLLGDRLWEYTAPFEDVVGCYFPCPICALRTLKAELGCGMDADQVERAAGLDENWLTNGRFGVVQFGHGAPKTS